MSQDELMEYIVRTLMSDHKRVCYILLTVLLISPALITAQQTKSEAVGIFESSTDIGKTRPGATIYNAATGEYTVTGAGADMWGTSDDFHFTWLRLSGDVTLTADVHFLPGNAVALKKAVLMVRQSLAPDSAYADVAIHGDGHITLQYRATEGGKTADTTSREVGALRLRIERKGNQFTIFAGSSGHAMTASPPETIMLHDPVYVGIGVCAHNAEGLETATFSNVSVDAPSRSPHRPK